MIPTTPRTRTLALSLCLGTSTACGDPWDPRDVEVEPDDRTADEVHFSYETYVPFASVGGRWGTTSITYTNASAVASYVRFRFIDRWGQLTHVSEAVRIEAGSAHSLYLGSTPVSDGWQGSAIVESSEPVTATVVQTGLLNRPMYDAMDFNDGDSRLYAAGSDAGRSVRIAAQNVTRSTISVNGVAVAPGQSAFLDGGTSTTELIATGRIVAVAIASSDEAMATATEAVPARTETTMAIAHCRNNDWGTHSVYRVHNPTALPSMVVIEYTDGSEAAEVVRAFTTHAFDTCANVPEGFNGGATIRSDTPIAAVGEVRHASRPGYTGFVGASDGADLLVLPYVRWWPTQVVDRQRTYIALSNTGDVALNATIEFVDARGVGLREQTVPIAAHGKANVEICGPGGCSCDGLAMFGTDVGNAASPRCASSQAGDAPAVWGGSALISSSEPALLATARTGNALASASAFDAEDYNGIRRDLEDVLRVGALGIGNHRLEYRIAASCQSATVDQLSTSFTVWLDATLDDDGLVLHRVGIGDAWYAPRAQGGMDSPTVKTIAIDGTSIDGANVATSAGNLPFELAAGASFDLTVPELRLDRETVISAYVDNYGLGGPDDGTCSTQWVLRLQA